MLAAVRSRIAKTGRSAGQRWAILAMEDLDGQIEGMCFAETFAAITQKYPDALQPESIVFVKGKVDKKRETPSILVTEVIPIEAALERLTTNMVLRLDKARHTLDHLTSAKTLLRANKGNLKVWVQSPCTLDGQDRTVTMQLPPDYAVKLSKTLIDDLRARLGNESVDLVGAGTRRKKRLEQQRLFKEEQVEDAELPTQSPGAADELVAAALDAESL
jgi:DNA polymerase-3 subunit alpha